MVMRIANPVQAPRPAITLLANPRSVATLTNPRRRKGHRRGGRRRNPVTAVVRNPSTGRFLANPRRRKGGRRNPAAVVSNPTTVRANPRRRRRGGFRLFSNPRLSQIFQGVGLPEVAGGIVGAFAAQEGPAAVGWDTKEDVTQTDGTIVQVASWKQVGATAVATGLTGVGLGMINRGMAAGAIVVGATITALKAIGNVSGGKFGMLAGSPTMHLVTGPASRAAVIQPAQLRALNGGNLRPTAVDVVQKTGLA